MIRSSTGRVIHCRRRPAADGSLRQGPNPRRLKILTRPDAPWLFKTGTQTSQAMSEMVHELSGLAKVFVCRTVVHSTPIRTL
jgi:hypothetical protein